MADLFGFSLDVVECDELPLSDEYYTPMYAVLPIIKYLKPNSKIWCPFDIDNSSFVRCLKNKGFDAVNTHIQDGDDFFEVEIPLGIDYIVSNPPFSKRDTIYQRLFDLDTPFAMLMSDNGLFGSKDRFDLFKDKPFEIMYFDKRVHYIRSGEEKKSSSPFNSVYVCSGVLPQQIVFEQLER